MAEVSLRLLRSKARQHLIEERILCGRKHGGSLAPPYLALPESTGFVAPEFSHKLRLYTLWPSGSHREPALETRMSSSQAVRLYSQWAGSRSYQQNGSRRNGGSDAQGPASPLYRSRTAYYDILEVTKGATQSQIKTAYYKQTFRFHPDRNSGNEDAVRHFALVTEAYHILGSVGLRKKYDRGILSLEDVRSAKKPSVKSSGPTRKEAGGPQEAAKSSTTPTNPMFDFDAFYQAHYGEQLARDQLWKAMREDIEQRKQKTKMASRRKLDDVSALLVVFALTVVCLTMR